MRTEKSRKDWVVAALRVLQTVSEGLCLVGIAIGLRKRLNRRLNAARAHVDREVQARVGSPAGVTSAASVFQPASRS